MYTGKLILTNTHRTPLALTNEFNDTFNFVDEVENCLTAEDFLTITNKFCKYGGGWKMDKDNNSETRLCHKDSLGNIHYLIAKKQEAVVQAEPVDKKTLYEVVGTGDIEGHSFVICTTYDKALKAKKVLKDLCQISDTDIATRVSVDTLLINDMEIKL